MNANEIKTAIDDGKTVFWESENYQVIKDANGQYLIECQGNGHAIGLTWQDGQTLNGNASDFYIKEDQAAPVSETMAEFEIAYDYTENRIRTVKAASLSEAIEQVRKDAEAGDCDIDYVLDGHTIEIQTKDQAAKDAAKAAPPVSGNLDIKAIFPQKDSGYTEDQIRDIADENDLQIEETVFPTFSILEIVECFHELNDPSGRTPGKQYGECDLTDDDHETLAEFRNDVGDGKRFFITE